MAVGRRDPNPPGNVLLISTVAQGVGGGGVTQRVPVPQQSLQQGAAQHQGMKQRRGGDAWTPGPPAAQLLLAEGGGTAATTQAPGWPARPGLGAGFGALAVGGGGFGGAALLLQHQHGSEVTGVVLLRDKRTYFVMKPTYVDWYVPSDLNGVIIGQN